MSSSSPPPDPVEPITLGCYAVERQITVAAALGIDFQGRRVWLKASECDGEALCGAEREYQALCVNPSSTVPEVFDLVREVGRCWSVTEFFEGRSLAEAMEDGVEFDVERFARDLLAGLLRSHAAGWVHGDVKPSNVLLRNDGAAVLVDWELATRMGKPAPPGTLGYAPPEAWEGGYCARPENDVYALAVLLTQLLRGERLFAGSRAEVVQAQAAHRFAEAEGRSDLLRAIFEAADRRSVEALTLPSLAELDVRTEHAIRIVCRGLASAQLAQMPSGTIIVPDTVPFTDQRPQLCRALAERWRVSHGANAIVLGDLVSHRLASGSSDTDGALETVRCSARDQAVELFERVRLLPPGVLLVDAERAGEPERLLAGELRRLLPQAPTVDCWRLVDVTGGGVADATVGVVRGIVRDALQVAFATAHVTGAVCEAVVHGGSSTLERVMDVVSNLVIEDVLDVGAGALDVSERGGGTVGGLFDTVAGRFSEHLSGPATVEGARPVDVVGRAEALLLRGDALAAYPFMVRATTELLEEQAPTPAMAVRVADLWLEIARPAGAELALATVADESAPLEVLRRRGRIAATSGDATSLRRTVDQMTALGCESDDLHLARFAALAQRVRGSFAEAHRRLRRALHANRRDRVSPALLEALVSLSGILRAQRRPHSALRILKLARRLADDEGIVRLGLKLDANILIVESRPMGAAGAAGAWQDLGRRCHRWGMQGAARRHFVRAALLLAEVGDIDGAETCLGRAHELAPSPRSLNEHWDTLHLMVEATVRAKRDRRQLPLEKPVGTVLDPIAWRAWLGARLENLSLASEVSLANATLPRRTRPKPVRFARLIMRWVERGGDASARLSRTLSSMDGACSAPEPLTTALARCVARGASDVWPLRGFLSVARDVAESDDQVLPFAIACHVAALAWTSIDDIAVATWLRSRAPEADDERPAGTFVWEWRLAILRADALLGQEADADLRMESALDALQSWAAQDGPEESARLLGLAPYSVIASTTGLALPADWEPAGVAGPVTRFRAHLRSESVRFRGARGRAAGLERVLSSALRLRSDGSIDDVLSEMVSGVLDVCRAERAVVVYGVSGAARHAKIATRDGVEDADADAAEVSRSAIEHARQVGRACIFDDACGASELGDAPSVRLYRPRSLMIAPVQSHGTVLGYVYVENRSLPKSFSPSDLQLLEGFAAQAGMALENARLVDELRQSLTELKRARTEAVRAESLRVLGQMAGEVAHDFNNLLAVILGEAQLVMQDRPDPGIQRSLEMIERAAMDGAAAIKRIQSSTRVRPREEFTTLDLGALVREVLDFTRVRCASGPNARSGRVRTHCRAQTDTRVAGLAPELREVFTNLVLNAVDAMPAGGDLEVFVRRVGDVGDVVEVEVKDTGSGIAPDVVERIFDPFFSTKGEQGNGLGLAIAKEIVERHGGALRVRSQPGTGTSMIVALPASKEPLATSSQPAAAIDAGGDASAAQERRSVLVVDDEQGVLRVLATMLRTEGFRVVEASSGEAATRRIEAGERFDLVITDLYMPGTSGVEVIEATRRADAAGRVVVMSGYGDIATDNRLAEFAIDGVLPKPFTLADVRDVVSVS